MTNVLDPAAPPSSGPPHRRDARGTRRESRRLRGTHDGDPAWTRLAFWVLLAGTAALYLWNLGASGNANSFYAAAVQAGTQSWKALLFGSLDAGNAITVDKPPAALWVMSLSGRIFGFSSWSMLVPQALEGVAAVALLHGAVRRTSGRVAGLVAGAALALTPAAALIFRYNNPDALLVLLMVAAAYCVVRALEAAGTRWLVLAGVALGFAFLTKMLQGFLVLPAFSLVYLIAAPTDLWRRVRQLLLAGLAIVVSGGWYVALVGLWPASSRPYIGGSSDDSLLQLALGYNGLQRLTGGSGGGGGGMNGAATGSSFGGATSIWRLFSNEFGNEVSWLLPAALVALAAGLWLTRRAPRTDTTRAALLLWGLWAVVTGLVFSYMSGTVHPYYTVALAPAIAALVAIGGREAWRARSAWSGKVSLAALVVAVGAWAFVLLDRNPSWYPALRWTIVVVSVLAALAVLAPARRAARLAVVAVTVGLLAGLTGTGAYAVATAATTHSGGVPSVGPASAASSSGGMGGPGGQGFPGGQGGSRPTRSSSSAQQPSSEQQPPSGRMGGSGGEDATTSSAVVKLLQGTSSRWAAATVGSSTAATLELSSGASVMAIGGFSGSDSSPTLAQFTAYVKAGDVRYFIAGSGMGGFGGGGSGTSTTAASQITTWVEAHYTATTVGGETVYDLSSPSS